MRFGLLTLFMELLGFVISKAHNFYESYFFNFSEIIGYNLKQTLRRSSRKSWFILLQIVIKLCLNQEWPCVLGGAKRTETI